jgi:hypothetical protein
MIEKIEQLEDETKMETNKIWCNEREGFQYIKACESNCRKNNRCKAFRNYLEPRLY